MTPNRQRLVILGVALLVGLPVLNAVVRVLTFTPTSTYLATLGGRIEPDDDLLPAGDPAFAPGLHAQYRFHVDRSNADPNAYLLRFGTVPPIAPPSAATLRTLACRVGGVLARPPRALHPDRLQIVSQLEPGRDTPPVNVAYAGCAPS